MKKIDEGFDNLLKSNYELYSIQLFELRDLAKSWYNGIDFKDFDNRAEYAEKYGGNEYVQMKRTGISCNYFFAYREDDKYYLMDGFNRLFTDYINLDIDCTVYLKVLTSKLEDSWLMYIMFTFNIWKLSKSVTREFNINDFFDRGFRLFMHSKFSVDFYHRKGYDERLRVTDDIDILDYYFVNEKDWAGDFKYHFDELAVLFSRKNIVNDIREIINSNDYNKPPFHNYEQFLRGFAMFLSSKRISGDDGEYKFQTYLDKLYKDKFFKKLQNMSWTDSTRKNIYKFFREL